MNCISASLKCLGTFVSPFFRVMIAVTAASLVTSAAIADHGDRHDSGHHWHGDIRYFHEHDYPHWREGRWHHGSHDGHVGWWWVAAGLWYFYEAPVYPYPDPYTPYAPPVVVVQQSPQPAAPIEVAPQPQYWYYCNSARNYYPYVTSCPEAWRQVPATPQR